jgi:hypothetical protein
MAIITSKITPLLSVHANIKPALGWSERSVNIEIMQTRTMMIDDVGKRKDRL